MQKNNISNGVKGFSNIFAIIGIIIFVGVAVYFVFSQKPVALTPTLITNSTSPKSNTNPSETESVKLDSAEELIQLSLSGEPSLIEFTGDLTLNMKIRNLNDNVITIKNNFSKLVFVDPSGRRNEYIFPEKDNKDELTLFPGDNNFDSFTDDFISEWFLRREIYLPPGCQSNELNPLYGPCAKLSIIPKGIYQIVWLFGDKKSNIVEVEIN